MDVEIRYEDDDVQADYMLNQAIPDSWLDDDGVRHIVVYMPDSDYEMVKVNNGWVLKERIPF